jgi:predicted permease
MGNLAQDIRYSLRMLARSPIGTVVVILSLCLGIGANTAIFTVLNALLLRPLPVPDPGQLVRLSTTTKERPERENTVSLATYEQLRRDQQVFSNLFAWSGGGIVNIRANGARYAASVNAVTGEYFSTLGIRPALGRFISPSDLSLDSGDPAPVAVLGYECWNQRYRGDPNVIGQTIWVEDRPLTIVGVTPKGFSGIIIDAASEVTVPIGYSGRTTYRDRKVSGLDVCARLKPGIRISQAQAQLKSAWPSVLQAAVPQDYAGNERNAFLSQRLVVASASTGNSFLRQRYSRPLFILIGMVGLLLIATCANLANLTLARAERRRHEFGIRVALGARRGRIVRQMITESVILSMSGALLGFIFAQWASRLMVDTIWTGFVPLSLDVTPDLAVFGFTALIAVLTGILFGASPAWLVFRTDPSLALKQGARNVGSGYRLGKFLIGAQVALSLVLVVGASLFVRSLQNLRSADVGFVRHGVLFVQLFPSSGSESQHMPNRVSYYRQLAERLQAIPGVESVSYSHMGPVLGYEATSRVSIPSMRSPAALGVFEAVGPGFFHVAKMRILAGRDFDWKDDETAKPVAIVSQSLADHVFPGKNPTGETIDFGGRKGLEIVGVVNSASLWLPQSRKPEAVFVALMQLPDYNSSAIDVRTSGDPATILPATRAAVESLGRQFVLRAETLDQRSNRFLVADRMIALLSSVFGGLALFLASIGLYGLTSYAVARRTSEIGLRLALGARPAGVLTLVLREVGWLVVIGIGIGIVTALAVSRTISSMIYGIEGNHTLTVLLSSLILLCAAGSAGYFPARRATRIDPMTALRSE